MNFERKVWSLIERIPKGRVTTYKIIAEKLGTRAYRAVGNACNRNPNAPEVPCHRVINSDGKIGGYVYGVKKKIELLRNENVNVTKCMVIDHNRILFDF